MGIAGTDGIEQERMKLKTASITYHAAHNYGAMLQAYALQRTILSLGAGNEIINLRTKVQRAHYPGVDEHLFVTLPHFLGWLLYGGPFSRLHKKYRLFESFLKENLVLTEEYDDPEQLSEDGIDADLFIAGSDQIWNTSQTDYNDAYFLPFVRTKRKVSYAASMGLMPSETVSEDQYDKIRSYLSGFKAISVRDEASHDLASRLTGKEILQHPDPTLLLDRDTWDHLSGDCPLVKGRYVLVYYPSTLRELDDLALKVGKLLGMKVVITNKTDNLDAFFHMKKYLGCGPGEFLNLVKNAAVVVTASFHATVFSLLFHRPFYVLDRPDARIETLLEGVGLTDRRVSEKTIGERISDVDRLDFAASDLHMVEMREKGIDYLKGILSHGIG